MSDSPNYCFPKQEKLCSKLEITNLMENGKWGSFDLFRYCYLATGEDRPARLVISVSKRFFKRAVKRNLLKRRIREAYRLNKSQFSLQGMDIMVLYSTKELLNYTRIEEQVLRILTKVEKSQR